MAVLVTLHSLLRWVLIVALTGAGGYALVQANRDVVFTDRTFVFTAVLIDVQAALGIVLYVWGQAWNDNAFMAVIHPVLMLAAVASVHIGLARARKREGRAAYRIVGAAYLFPLVLFAFGVPWSR